MAFFGKDWRDPGSEYLKSKDDGIWESKKICRLRMFEMLNENIVKRSFRQSISTSDNKNQGTTESSEPFYFAQSGFYQPHIKLITLSTKESKIVTSITDVFQCLDFLIALKDVRRFGYIFRVVEILALNELPNLSGRTQIYVIRLLKEIFNQVVLSKNNIDQLRKLLNDLEKTLVTHKYNHVGSSQLWMNHMTAVSEMQYEIEKHDLFNSSPSHRSLKDSFKLDALPPECLWRILLHVTSPHDLQVVSETSPTLYKLANDELLWKKLVLYHFSRQQLSSLLVLNSKRTGSIDDCNWKFVYKRLLKVYGDHHYYPTKLARCNHCSSLFWPIFGHPCNHENESYALLSPANLIKLFPI